MTKYPLMEKHSKRQTHNRMTKCARHWEYNESKLTGTKQNQRALHRWAQGPVVTGASTTPFVNDMTADKTS